MMREKLKLFLMVDAGIILVFLVFILHKLNRRGIETQFKDDLWAERKEAEKTGRLPEFEAKVDNKILLEHKQDPKDPDEAPAPSTPAFKVPNFRGPPHEILGIPAKHTADLVNKAFKHWIKRYHPDRVTHLGSGYVEQARRRAEQLNTARNALLKGLKS